MKTRQMKAFTIRIPPELHSQIEARAAIAHRVLNAEITLLLTKAIDDSVSADLKAARSGQKAD